MSRHHRSRTAARPRVEALFAGIALAALLCHPRPSAAQMVQTDLDMTDGPVYAVALAGNNIYLGGQFTRVGPVSEHGAVLSSSGRLVHALQFDFRPFTSAPDGAGGWFIGGEFSLVNGL